VSGRVYDSSALTSAKHVGDSARATAPASAWSPAPGLPSSAACSGIDTPGRGSTSTLNQKARNAKLDPSLTGKSIHPARARPSRRAEDTFSRTRYGRHASVMPPDPSAVWQMSGGKVAQARARQSRD